MRINVIVTQEELVLALEIDGNQIEEIIKNIDFTELEKMFSNSDIITDTLEFWDAEKKYPRKKYNFNARSIVLQLRSPKSANLCTYFRDFTLFSIHFF